MYTFGLLEHLEETLKQAHRDQQAALKAYRDACLAEDHANGMLREFNRMRNREATMGNYEAATPMEVSQERPPERGRDR